MVCEPVEGAFTSPLPQFLVFCFFFLLGNSAAHIPGCGRMYSIPLLALLGGLLISLYKFIIYPAFLSPLAKIPNAHFSSGFSPVWILWKRYTSAENRTIHDAHQKKGPIVRLGPNDISINCVEAGVKTVYSGGFEKPNWYPNVFFNFG